VVAIVATPPATLPSTSEKLMVRFVAVPAPAPVVHAAPNVKFGLPMTGAPGPPEVPSSPSQPARMRPMRPIPMPRQARRVTKDMRALLFD
jgi:hypothetical protein